MPNATVNSFDALAMAHGKVTTIKERMEALTRENNELKARLHIAQTNCASNDKLRWYNSAQRAWAKVNEMKVQVKP